MSMREREQDEGPDTAYMPCGVCGVAEADHGHMWLYGCLGECGEAFSEHPTHDWEMPEDNSPEDRDED
jgi:hypothetical protein